MKNKLITLPIGTTKIPQLSVGQTYIYLEANQRYIISPSVTNIPNGNTIYGYTATVYDASVIDIIPYTEQSDNEFIESEIVLTQQSKTVVGKKFEIIGKTLNETKTTQIEIVGNETGGSIIITVEVNAYQQ